MGARRGCIFCARKHVGQVLVLMDEDSGWWFDLGDPHVQRIEGHLAEIESHLGDTDLSSRVSDVRAVRTKLTALALDQQSMLEEDFTRAMYLVFSAIRTVMNDISAETIEVSRPEEETAEISGNCNKNGELGKNLQRACSTQ